MWGSYCPILQWRRRARCSLEASDRNHVCKRRPGPHAGGRLRLPHSRNANKGRADPPTRTIRAGERREVGERTRALGPSNGPAPGARRGSSVAIAMPLALLGTGAEEGRTSCQG